MTVMASPAAPAFAFLLITKSVLSVTLRDHGAGRNGAGGIADRLVGEEPGGACSLVSAIVVFFLVTVPVTAVVCGCDSVVPGLPLRPGHPKSRGCGRAAGRGQVTTRATH